MRDFRDAKTMAHALRDALKAKSVETTHSEALELIAKAFGFDNWNILSARIETAQPRAPDGPAEPGPQATLNCTFCGKSQHDVRTLIAGPASIYICDECVTVCNDVIDGQDDRAFLSLLEADEEAGNQAYPTAIAHLKDQSTKDLVSFVERFRRATPLYRFSLQEIQDMLAIRDGEAQADREALAAPRFARLRNMSRDELVADRQRCERGLRRYEAALRIAVTVLGERRP